MRPRVGVRIYRLSIYLSPPGFILWTLNDKGIQSSLNQLTIIFNNTKWLISVKSLNHPIIPTNLR